VLFVLALLGVFGAEFAFSMRLEASMARSYKERVLAAHLAEAGVEQAIREIITEATLVGHPDDEPLTFFRTPAQPIKRLTREGVPLGPGELSYRITDEESRLDLNRSPADRLDRLLAVLDVDKRVRDTIVDSIQDWRDANEEHRLNGAESEDTYLELPVPYRSRNANFEDIRELLQVKGVTPEVYHGDEGRPGLRDLLTVRGNGPVNINTAPEIVLKALGLADAEISEIVQSRRSAPYATVPARFASRGLSATTRTFRIEAQGRIHGVPRVRVMAVVQKRSGEPAWTVLGWDPDAERPREAPAR
jgi:general secretion pathway protein K